MVEFCVERGLCVGNTYFNHRRVHKYTRVAKGQDGVEIKSMVDLVLVVKDMLRYVQDVRALGVMGRGLSDHHVELCKVRLVEAWIKKREMVVGARRIRRERERVNSSSNNYLATS